MAAMDWFQSFTESKKIYLNGRGLSVRSTMGTREILVHGPYITAPKGRYTVKWQVNVRREVMDTDLQPALRLDITIENGKRTLIEKDFSLAEIRASNGIAQLDFEVLPDDVKNLELRALSLGVADFLIGMKRYVVNESDQIVYFDADFFDIESQEATQPVLVQFIAENLQSLSRLRQWGVKLIVANQSLKGRFQGCDFHIRNVEDFQIFQEVFVQKDYDVELPGELVVADVGMNVGYASLRFASMNWVQRVYSFEPFGYPFARAIENFNLNADIRSKIFPFCFGLFDANTQREVRYDDQQTISTSVRGASAGRDVTIQLREASSVLGPIIRNAKARGWRFMLKLDCEGSEFPIIENLYSTGLLKEIDILLLEWHKWWDRSKSQRALIEPLLENGFLVLDRTRDDNPHAGVIMACRIS
jgi:FkbM family methyltransferase